MVKKGLLKEIADFYCFFWKTLKEKKKITFYAEHRDYYPCFEGIIKKLIEKRQNICYVTSDPEDPILEKSDPKIKTFYINKLLIFFMTSVNSKIFVMTLTDLNQFHIKRSLKPVHYVYVFHAMVSTNMMYRYGAFDYYDSILCTGPQQIKEIRKYEELNKLHPKKLVKAGYYRLERIYEAYQKYKKSSNNNILIAPSWGKDNVFESCGEKLIDILLKKKYNVIVRPHPETVKHSSKLLDSFVSKFSNNPNFTLERSVATDDSFLKADVLISDCSGVALEYAFGTERPVLFLDVPPKVKNPKFKELSEPLELYLRPKIGIIVSPNKLDSVPKVISKLIAEKGAYKKNIAELRKKYIYSFGFSSDIGAEYIIKLLKEAK